MEALEAVHGTVFDYGSASEILCKSIFPLVTHQYLDLYKLENIHLGFRVYFKQIDSM